MLNSGGAEGIRATVVDSYKPEGAALFAFLKELPLYGIVLPIALFLIVIFFVTSFDSGGLVIDTITAGGKMDAAVSQRVFWFTLEGLVAIALLLGGGLAALQGAAISTGIPFTIVVLLMCWCVFTSRFAPKSARNPKCGENTGLFRFRKFPRATVEPVARGMRWD